jgi:hypothetical protein
VVVRVRGRAVVRERLARPADHVLDRVGEVLLESHKLRVARGDHHIDRVHLADAIEQMTERSRESLSDDRSPKDPYGK